MKSPTKTSAPFRESHSLVSPAKDPSRDTAEGRLVEAQPTIPPSAAPQRPPNPASFKSVDLFRDQITGEIFADPVFCDKGHTHERSCIEHHFQSRREQKVEEERRQREQRSTSLDDDDSCRRATNFDPTCPFTGEPVSEILIQNDQCDRLVVSLIESGLISLDGEELQNWKERREEKTKLVGANRAAANQQPSQEEAQPPPLTLSEHPITSQTVQVVRPCQPTLRGRIDLGVSVALCPNSFISSVTTHLWLRCTIACCRSRLDTRHHQSCSRCAQTVCSYCLDFEVNEATPLGNADPERRYFICPECVWQIIDALASNDASKEPNISSMGKVMGVFFEQLSERKSQAQEQVIRYDKQHKFTNVAQRLQNEIRGLEQSKEALDGQIQSTRRLVENARNDQGELGSALSRTPREEELYLHISDLESEYSEIDGFNEDNILRYSLIEYELDEAKMELVMIESSKATMISANTTTSTVDVELAAQCEAIMREHDELEARGPTNENDEAFALHSSDLMCRYDKLSLELILLREKNSIVQNSARCPIIRLGKIAYSLSHLVPETIVTSATGNPVSSPENNLAKSTNLAASTDASEEEKEEMPVLGASAIEAIASDLLSIGQVYIKTGPLPLNLSYPSSRMRNQVLLLLNDLQGRRLKLERELDAHYLEQQRALEACVDILQDEISIMWPQVVDAQTAVAKEERLREERIHLRQKAERERLGRERERVVEERRNRREKERLEQVQRQQEDQTRQALKGQDLRCCGKCGFGPFTKFSCNDMAAHNDKIYVIDKKGRRRQRGSNECPECGWFDCEWRNWPKYRV